LAHDIPSKILLISFYDEKAYFFNSLNYENEINKQGISNIRDIPIKTFTPLNLPTLKNQVFDKVDYVYPTVDEYNVVSLGKRYYEDLKVPTTHKGKKLKFRDELQNPQILKIKPLSLVDLESKEKNEFKGILDQLNDKTLQKELGAFYTPPQYCHLSTLMVRDAIERIKKANLSNDYIILDTCSGTGALLQFLNDEELSHVICSTYETWEWNILNSLYRDKVRMIIPPEVLINKTQSTVNGGDALSKGFIKGNTGNEVYDNYIKQLNN
jgi:type I restriction-modification system DNA methylase subunit